VGLAKHLAVHLLLLGLLARDLRLDTRHELGHGLVLRRELSGAHEVRLGLIVRTLGLACARASEEGLDVVAVDRERVAAGADRLGEDRCR
jgi:hypothetical protein